VLQKYYLGTANVQGLNAAAAMMFIFAVFYGSLIEGTIYVYLSEIWPTHLRSHGAMIGFGSFWLNAIAYTTPAAEAFASIGWKYYLVLFSMSILCATIVLFFFPEVSQFLW
jgi:hypothetical protein